MEDEDKEELINEINEIIKNDDELDIMDYGYEDMIYREMYDFDY